MSNLQHITETDVSNKCSKTLNIDLHNTCVGLHNTVYGKVTVNKTWKHSAPHTHNERSKEEINPLFSRVSETYILWCF